jgi:hypothetical protein
MKLKEYRDVGKFAISDDNPQSLIVIYYNIDIDNVLSLEIRNQLNEGIREIIKSYVLQRNHSNSHPVILGDNTWTFTLEQSMSHHLPDIIRLFETFGFKRAQLKPLV